MSFGVTPRTPIPNCDCCLFCFAVLCCAELSLPVRGELCAFLWSQSHFLGSAIRFSVRTLAPAGVGALWFGVWSGGFGFEVWR